MIMCRSERLPRVLSINANTMAGLLFRAMLALVCQGIGQSGQTIAPQPRRASRASVAIRSTGIFYPIRGAIARPRRKVASRLGAFIAGSDHLGDPRRHVGLIVAPHKMLRGPSSDAPLELVNGSRDFGDWHFGHSVPPPVLSRPRRQPPRAALPAAQTNLYYCSDDCLESDTCRPFLVGRRVSAKCFDRLWEDVSCGSFSKARSSRSSTMKP